MKTFIWVFLALSVLPLQASHAGNKEGASAKAIKKLQMMVKDVTTERDLLKTDNAKVVAELAELIKQQELDKKAAQTLADKQAKDLQSQQKMTSEVRLQLENTTVRLREVIDKYNALNKAKNELAAEHGNLKNTQQFTASELKGCESKNIKMAEGGREIINGYQKCQNKDLVDVVMDSEPFSQIKTVEFETIVQEYEDKLYKQKFHGKANATK
ncbi:MAG: hypothetical protein ABL933_13095 [Methyloglobulus sp.]|nr:hypothetical protein [Methyloglobulus sp.]